MSSKDIEFLERAGDEFNALVRERMWESAKRVIEEVAQYGYTSRAVDMCRVLLSKKMRV